jgi:hypothetical protein
MPAWHDLHTSTMTPDAILTFEPSKFRSHCWIAEAPLVRYTIYQSISGFVVHYQRIAPGATGQTVPPERLRIFFLSFDQARSASEEHYHTVR